MKKKVLKNCIIILMVVCLGIFLLMIFADYAYRRKFIDNQKNESYSLKVPLDQMDFSAYTEYFPNNQVLTDPNYSKCIILPCDVDYFNKKEDDEPVITLKKGTTVYILPNGVTCFPTIGYGLQCWPDYQSGWRYGHPFFTEDIPYSSEKYPMYYVKTEQLKKVARAFWKANIKELHNYYVISSEFAIEITSYIDRVLYSNGVYCVQ